MRLISRSLGEFELYESVQNYIKIAESVGLSLEDAERFLRTFI